MKITKITLFLLSSLICCSLMAQDKKTVISMKKGEILDILLFHTKDNVDQAFQKYRETAFPVAMKMGYSPLPLLSIPETKFGNIQPSSLAFGKWTDLESREEFISTGTNQIPNFHNQRKDIWYSFYLTYYEMTDDLDITIDHGKYLVATAMWNDKKSDEYLEKVILQMSKAGGKHILQLSNGKSPFGYLYKPDLFIITEWKDEAAYIDFCSKNNVFNSAELSNANQFVLK